jgi:hypothetical protein
MPGSKTPSPRVSRWTSSATRPAAGRTPVMACVSRPIMSLQRHTVGVVVAEDDADPAGVRVDAPVGADTGLSPARWNIHWPVDDVDPDPCTRFALDPVVSPTGVLSCHSFDQRDDGVIDRRASCSWVGRLLGQHASVSLAECSVRDAAQCLGQVGVVLVRVAQPVMRFLLVEP